MDGNSKSLTEWTRFLWQGILFPNAALVPTETFAWKPFFLLFTLAALLLLPALNYPMFEPDETRYAEIPREMLAQGEWVVPLLGGEPYFDKPPMYYWLTMLSYKAFGVGTWQARLPPALISLVGLLTAYSMGRLIVGNRAAFLGALLLILSPGYFLMGKLMLLDGLLSLFTTLALLSGYLAIRSGKIAWPMWLFSAGAAGFGLLAKGPIIIVLVGAPLFLAQLIDSRLVRITRWQWLAWLSGAASLSLPWYFLIGFRQPGFFLHFLWEHHVVRFFEPFDHQRGVFFYIPVLLGGLLPLTLVLWVWVKHLVSSTVAEKQNRRVETGFLLLSGGWCVLFFSLSGCKLPTYVLPAFVPFALACGEFLQQSSLGYTRFARTTGCGLFAILFILHVWGLPWLAQYRSPLAAESIVRAWGMEPGQAIRCFPRESNAFAFSLARDDLKHFRSKDFDAFRTDLLSRPRTIVLCTHRHALEGLKQLLPDQLKVTSEHRVALPPPFSLSPENGKKWAKLLGETALGLCDVAVIEKKTTRRESTSFKPPGR